MQWLLAVRHSSPFHARRHIVVVPNVSWGLFPWEADLIVARKSRYLVEIETKISMADWKADFAKGKFGLREFADMVREFWYCAPERLAARWTELPLPEFAGVIAITEDDKIKILRPAKTRKTARKLTDKEILQIARLGAIKAWRRHNPNSKANSVREQS